jgi:hypothetical protein
MPVSHVSLRLYLLVLLLVDSWGMVWQGGKTGGMAAR